MSEEAVRKAIEIAASRLGAKVGDVAGYYEAGGDWDADTVESLADLIVECWEDQDRQEEAGMGEADALPATPAGWMLGADCGYPRHGGFVKDCANGRDHWSLTSDGGGWTLTRVVGGTGESARRFATLAEAVDYVR